MGRLSLAAKVAAIALLQFVLANVVTLLLSFPVSMSPDENPYGVIATLLVTSLIGISLGGWIGFRVCWLPGAPHYALRIIVTGLSIGLVLLLALLLGQVREASPFLTGSFFAGIVGFHAAGWRVRQEKVTPA